SGGHLVGGRAFLSLRVSLSIGKPVTPCGDRPACALDSVAGARNNGQPITANGDSSFLISVTPPCPSLPYLVHSKPLSQPRLPASGAGDEAALGELCLCRSTPLLLTIREACCDTSAPSWSGGCAPARTATPSNSWRTILAWPPTPTAPSNWCKRSGSAPTRPGGPRGAGKGAG